MLCRRPCVGEPFSGCQNEKGKKVPPFFLQKKIGECKLEIVIPKGVYQRDIVGPKGKNIRAITSATGTYIDVNDPLLIMGSEEAVDTAKEVFFFIPPPTFFSPLPIERYHIPH